jgi:hypothetical protein
MSPFVRWRNVTLSQFELFLLFLLAALASSFALLSVGSAVLEAVGIVNRRPTESELLRFVAGPSQFWYETKEKWQFLIFTFAIASNIVIASRLWSRARTNSGLLPVLAKLSPSIVLLVLVGSLVASRDFAFPTDVVDTANFGIFAALWRPVAPALYWPVLVLVVGLYLFSLRRRESSAVAAIERFSLTAGHLAAIYFAVRLSWVVGPQMLGWSPQIVHESVLVQPTFEAMRGGFVYSTVSSQYGGFAQFAALLAFLELDARTTFLTAMVIVCAVEFLAIFWALRVAGCSALMSLVGLLAVVWFTPVVFTDYSLFQCLQIRWLFPLLMILLAANVHRGGARSEWAAWSLLPVAVFWNPETGLVSSFAWLSFMVWRGLNHQETARRMLAGGLCSIASTASVVVAYYMASGRFPDIVAAFQYISIFSQAGFGMLPMSAVHWWNIYALIAVGGLLFAWLFPGSRASGAVWVAGNVCFLLFPYFLGRSYVTNLFWIGFPALMVWTMAVALPVMQRSFSTWQVVLSIPLLAAASATLTTPFNWPPVISSESDAQSASERAEILRFMKSSAIDKTLQTAAFVAPQGYALSELAGQTPRALPPALAATLLVEQAEEWERYALSARELFVDDAFFGPFADLGHPWPKQFASRLLENFEWNSELLIGGNRLRHGVRKASTVSMMGSSAEQGSR